MGCSQSLEMPLQKAVMKRNKIIDFSVTDVSFRSETFSICDDFISYKPQLKLPIRTLLRYGNLTIFRSLYCSFKFWKKFKGSAPICMSLQIYEFSILSKPKVKICYTEVPQVHTTSEVCLSKPQIEILIIKQKKLISSEEIQQVQNEYFLASEKINGILHEVAVKNLHTGPYSLKATFNLFEDLMGKKYILDCKELKEQKKPRELSEFLVDYMNRSFGIQSVAQQTLNKLLTTLEQNKSHKYLLLFCRLLKIGDSRPVPLNLLTFICKARWEFTKVTDGYPSLSAKMKRKVDLSMLKNMETGGSALLIDVFEWVSKNFKVKSVRQMVVQRIVPSQLSLHEYLIFYSCYRSGKSGSPCNTSGKSKSELLESLISSIDFPLTPDQYLSLQTYFEGDLKLLNYALKTSTFAENTLNLSYSISKCDFLLGLIEVYNQVQSKAFEISVLEYTNYEEMTFPVFSQSIHSLDKNFPNKSLPRLFFEGISLNPGSSSLSLNAFVYLVLYYNIGVLKDFRNPHIETPNFHQGHIERRIDYADICLKPTDAIDINSPLIRSRTLK